MKTWNEMKALEGKRVRVLRFGGHVYSEGVLVSLSPDGGAAVRADNGTIWHSWPVLDMEEL